jgi:hypothetical protein
MDQWRGHIVRPVGMRIPQSLSSRIYDCCISSVSKEWFDEVQSLLLNHKSIWFNLRAHNKRWVSQVDGIVALVKELSREFPNLVIVLDGWIDAEVEAKSIMERLPEGVCCINSLGCELAESVVLANMVSTYCSVVGSGLVINSWLAPKRGFAHGNSGHLGQRRFWNAVVGEDRVTFLENKSVISKKELYDDYDFDWKEALHVLQEQLRR